MGEKTSFTPIIIVSYRTPDDLSACLGSLDTLRSRTDLSVYICENGGPAAWEDLCSALLQENGPCVFAKDIIVPVGHDFKRTACFKLRQSGRKVIVGEAPENLGYAGGINSWLRPLLADSNWAGCWILNPDTKVEPDALIELVEQARGRSLDMVGSRIMLALTDTHVACWGLRWRRLTAEWVLPRAKLAGLYRACRGDARTTTGCGNGRVLLLESAVRRGDGSFG